MRCRSASAARRRSRSIKGTCPASASTSASVARADADGVQLLSNDQDRRQGIERLEIEEETTELFFTTVWPLTRGCRVRKRRYLVADGGATWEIDEFLDRQGLWLAEIELERVDDVVVPPDWLREAIEREVTDEPQYTNHALAR